MNVYKIIYKSLNKTKPIKYSYELTQMIEIMKDNLTSEQNKIFDELVKKITNEEYKTNYKWYFRGIRIAREFIIK
jgi:hypothetical protein